MRRYAGSTGRTAQGEWVFVDDLGLEVRVVGGFEHWRLQLWIRLLYAATDST